MFQIEKGIPMPERARFIPKAQKYPFDQMTVGDSFAIEIDKATEGPVLCRRVRNAAHRWRVQNLSTLAFTPMVVKEDGVDVVRVWCSQGEMPAVRPRKPKAAPAAQPENSTEG